jgi:hypothetical protein
MARVGLRRTIKLSPGSHIMIGKINCLKYALSIKKQILITKDRHFFLQLHQDRILQFGYLSIRLAEN